jgi:predicted AlkP superfamily pyrophosphatase or phosphodiesterase
MEMSQERKSLDTICAALCYAMGVPAPQFAAEPNPALKAYIDEQLGNKRADRVFMFNPDAIAQWIAEKYPALLEQAKAQTDIEIPLRSVMPSVTPVCYGTMYTGAQPEVHGIQAYAKPVITIDTIFDVLLWAGKKPVILAYGQCSLSKIYLEREMDYFIFPTMDEVNAKAVELILEDKYDFYVVYNGNYDTAMHKFGPESIEALSELRANGRTFAMFAEMLKTHWSHHNTLLGFAMDHGCHEAGEGRGAHGLDMDEDLHIKHLYKVLSGKI